MIVHMLTSGFTRHSLFYNPVIWAVSLLLLAGCSGHQTEGQKEVLPDPIIETCHGIFRENSHLASGKELQKKLRVREAVAFRVAARSLRKTVDDPYTTSEMCTLTGKVDVDVKLAIGASWRPLLHQSLKEQPLIYIAKHEKALVPAELVIQCGIPQQQQAERELRLRISMLNDDVLESVELRQAVLLTVGERLTAELGCGNELDFSDPYIVDEGGDDAPPADEGSPRPERSAGDEQVAR